MNAVRKFLLIKQSVTWRRCCSLLGRTACNEKEMGTQSSFIGLDKFLMKVTVGLVFSWRWLQPISSCRIVVWKLERFASSVFWVVFLEKQVQNWMQLASWQVLLCFLFFLPFFFFNYLISGFQLCSWPLKVIIEKMFVLPGILKVESVLFFSCLKKKSM